MPNWCENRAYIETTPEEIAATLLQLTFPAMLKKLKADAEFLRLKEKFGALEK
jgi:hypothetical protein